MATEGVRKYIQTLWAFALNFRIAFSKLVTVDGVRDLARSACVSRMCLAPQNILMSSQLMKSFRESVIRSPHAENNQAGILLVRVDQNAKKPA